MKQLRSVFSQEQEQQEQQQQQQQGVGLWEVGHYIRLSANLVSLQPIWGVVFLLIELKWFGK